MIRWHRSHLPVLAVIVSASACLTYDYVTRVERPFTAERLALHRQILRGDAPSPYNDRVLVPWVTEAGARLAAATGAVTYDAAWTLAYAVYDFLAITFFLVGLFCFASNWHPAEKALVGVLFCAALLPISLRDHYFQPWSLLEAGLFCLAYELALERRFALMGLVTAAASLNRETGIYLPVLYLLGIIEFRWIANRNYRELIAGISRSAFLFLISLSILWLLRHSRGQGPPLSTIDEILRINTSPRGLILAAVQWSLFLGAGWVLALQGIRYADEFLCRQLLIIPLYLAPVLIFGIWKEVRLLLPLYPLFTALLLYRIDPDGAAPIQGQSVAREPHRDG